MGGAGILCGRYVGNIHAGHVDVVGVGHVGMVGPGLCGAHGHGGDRDVWGTWALQGWDVQGQGHNGAQRDRAAMGHERTVGMGHGAWWGW